MQARRQEIERKYKSWSRQESVSGRKKRKEYKGGAGGIEEGRMIWEGRMTGKKESQVTIEENVS